MLLAAQSTSLSQKDLTVEEARAHVLTPSNDVPGEFITLDGWVASLVGNEVGSRQWRGTGVEGEREGRTEGRTGGRVEGRGRGRRHVYAMEGMRAWELGSLGDWNLEFEC